MERGGGGSSSGGGSGLGEDNRCACGRTLQMVGVHVTPTTGGQFELRVASTDSIEFLRRLVSKRLRVPKERICLLYRDRHLREGTLEENSILDGARITLLPSVETGLLTQRPEQSVMQALESLNDGQVNDFLTGKAPLNLTMRLGDHMMLIQLQLSTVSPGGSRKTRLQPTHSHSHTHTHAHTHAHAHSHTHNHTHTHNHSHNHDHGGAARTSTHTHPLTPPYTPHTTCSGYSPVHTAHVSSQSTIPASMTINPSQTMSSTSTASNTPTRANSPSSPSSLSSSSSSPSSTSATLHNHQHNLLHHHHLHHYSMGCGSPSSPPPPYLATPPHHHHHHHHHHRPTPGSPSTPNSPTSSSSSGSNSSSPSGFGYDGELPVRGCPHRGEDTDPRASLDTKALAEASRNLTQTLKQLSSEVLTSKPEPKEDTVTPHEVAAASLGSLGGNSSSSSSSTGNGSSSGSSSSSSSSSNSSNSGSGGFSNNSSSSSNSSSNNSFGGVRKQGAIIESMHHHGKGVYSGTFSGTLNPALQDRQGRPKRDISTIIHILNDLLCATPQYRRHSTSISVSTSTPTTIRNRNNGGNAKRGTQQMSDVSTSGLQSQDSMTDAYGRKSADSAQNVDQDSGDENQAMRTKVEQLRMIMEQRRARRKARRDARARPYPHTAASWSTDTSVPTVVTTSGTAATSTTQAMDVDSGKADGADPTTLCELNSETVVA
ncbi:midnolin isoform X2 [Panulirus ornatus]|uniref:midnolin isoform X2 n=1 Tax=Panulirus ornatus TaxID=150431 RepID=UPI003A8BB62B